MLRVDVLTIFPKMFHAYAGESVLKRAQQKGLLRIKVHNLRRWTKDKHRTVDARPYGGGAGMIMKVDPIFRAIQTLQGKTKNGRVVLFAARGKQFDQRMVKRFSKYNHLILICGRYEGVDERVAKYIADEEISIGPYVLTGGELPAMVVIDAAARMVPGVLGNPDSLREETFSFKETRDAYSQKLTGGIGEYPQYTRPETFYPIKGKKKVWRVPKELLSGNHKKIIEWRYKHMRTLTS